jgi:3-hydroxyisobutyrate dehydrogenase-like beta-hydroxyacid dehydrogenase
MSTSMALNLLKAGHYVIVYNRTRSKADTLAAKGAQIADTCRGDVLITMLGDDAAVEDITFGRACLSALGRKSARRRGRGALVAW